MSSSSLEDKVFFKDFYVKGDYLFIVEPKGTTVKRHKTISDRLKEATEKELKAFEIMGKGKGVHWEKFDEDLSAAYLIYPEKF